MQYTDIPDPKLAEEIRDGLNLDANEPFLDQQLEIDVFG